MFHVIVVVKSQHPKKGWATQYTAAPKLPWTAPRKILVWEAGPTSLSKEDHICYETFPDPKERNGIFMMSDLFQLKWIK